MASPKAHYAEALSSRPKAGKKELRTIEIEKAENGGHIVTHRFVNNGPGYHESEAHVFGGDEGRKLVTHLEKHLGIKAGAGNAAGGDE